MKKSIFLTLFTLLLSTGSLSVLAQDIKCGATDYVCQRKVVLAQMAVNPKDVENYYEMGRLYQLSGNDKEAVEMFTMYITVGVSNQRHMADGYNSRGVSQKRLGNFELAIKDYTSAIGLAPTDASLYVNRANAYRDMKNYTQAIAEYTRAAEVDGKHAPAYVGRGHVYMMQKDLVRALADFTKSIEIDPKEGEGYYNRGTVYFQQTEYAKALPDFDKYISLGTAAPASLADGYQNRGICHLATGAPQKAIDDMNKVLSIDPNRGSVYRVRAMAYKQLNQPDLAAADERKAAEMGN